MLEQKDMIQGVPALLVGGTLGKEDVGAGRDAAVFHILGKTIHIGQQIQVAALAAAAVQIDDEGHLLGGVCGRI